MVKHKKGENGLKRVNRGEKGNGPNEWRSASHALSSLACSGYELNKPNKPDKLNKPDSSGPDPCWVERHGFWLKAIVAGKLKMAVQLSSEKGPGKNINNRGKEWKAI